MNRKMEEQHYGTQVCVFLTIVFEDFSFQLRLEYYNQAHPIHIDCRYFNAAEKTMTSNTLAKNNQAIYKVVF